MREITATRTVFTFDELPPAARRKAIDLLRADAWECLDCDLVGDMLAERFANLADGNPSAVSSRRDLLDKYRIRLFWSLGYVQSDNAQIGGVLSRDYHPQLAWPYGIHTVRVTPRNHGWSTVTNVYLVDHEDGGEGSETWDSDLIDTASRFVMRLCETVYGWAREECEALTEERYVLESFFEAGLQRRFLGDGSYAPAEFWVEDEVTA